jgi:hypothetical protein
MGQLYPTLCLGMRNGLPIVFRGRDDAATHFSQTLATENLALKTTVENDVDIL